MGSSLFTIHGTPITWINLMMFLGVFLLSFLVAKGIARIMQKNSPEFYGLSRLAYYVVFLVGFYLALMIIGIDLTGIAVVVGTLSVGIGFGLQAIVNNFVAGVIVLLEKKIHPGDFIDLQGGKYGKVLEINVRTTIIETLEGSQVVIPNTEIIARSISIRGRFHRIVVPFLVSRGINKEDVRKHALRIAEKETAEVWLTKLNDDRAEYTLVIWAREQKSIFPYVWDLEDRFTKANIKIFFA